MKKLGVQLIAFADYASIAQDGKLSIAGIFDRVNVTQFPGGLPNAVFVAIIKGESNTSYSLIVQGELGKETIFPPIKMDMRLGDNGQGNVIINLPGFGFPKEGQYEFVIYEGKEKVGSAQLDVIQVKQNGPTYKLPN